ncbi:MAG: hypothetical protein ABJB55_05490 [Actinomycetota bacterium]
MTADASAMNAWLTTAKLVPVLGLIPLGAAVQASFMQRDPARIRVRANGENARIRRHRSRG